MTNSFKQNWIKIQKAPINDEDKYERIMNKLAEEHDKELSRRYGRNASINFGWGNWEYGIQSKIYATSKRSAKVLESNIDPKTGRVTHFESDY